MKFTRFTLVVLLLAALSFIHPTWATSFSNDQSDLWWNSSENGWGIQFVQRGSTSRCWAVAFQNGAVAIYKGN